MLKELIVLSSVEGLSVKKLQKLVDFFGNYEEIVRCRNAHTMVQNVDISLELANRIVAASSEVRPNVILDRCHEQNIHLISYVDPRYPKSLSEIYDPPILLYVKGHLFPEDRQSIGIVGSRKASIYGHQTALQFASELADRGFTICSGLARGIDKMSHEGALRVQGRTIAVLGCGVDVIYPKENASLYQSIVEQGAVVSEFPLGTQPRPYYFPKRNRIIAGLSLGILVVEAGQKSGSLITAHQGMDEGREVYVVPGQINSPYSLGTNQLIKEGAKLVTSAAEIAEDLSPQLKDKYELDFNEGENVNSVQINSTRVGIETPVVLTPKEALFLDNLKQPKDSQSMSDELSCSVTETLKVLTSLEMKKKVSRRWGGLFEKVS